MRSAPEGTEAPRFLAIPNISDGRDSRFIGECTSAVEGAGATVLDVHSDEAHNRSVITTLGNGTSIEDAMTVLAERCKAIDLTVQSGVHPRLGGLDVCPVVPLDTGLVDVVAVAQSVARRIGTDVGLPVYLYGAAARRPETHELPDLRRGGLKGLIERARTGLVPDEGTVTIDPRMGVVCVGAREVLIAFNVWLEGGVEIARQMASEVRVPGRVRALGLNLGGGRSQVSMNLVAPETTGVDEAYEFVRSAAQRGGVVIVGTELVGLVPERFLPDPKREAARLLVTPGRSLEAAVER